MTNMNLRKQDVRWFVCVGVVAGSSLTACGEAPLPPDCGGENCGVSEICVAIRNGNRIAEQGCVPTRGCDPVNCDGAACATNACADYLCEVFDSPRTGDAATDGGADAGQDAGVSAAQLVRVGLNPMQSSQREAVCQIN